MDELTTIFAKKNDAKVFDFEANLLENASKVK
jgi:hypothetical protein